jgi:hypothetical protein
VKHQRGEGAVKKYLLAFLLATSSAQAATIPAGDWIQWYSLGSSFDFANQTFEYANDIARPTNATGVFAPFNGSTSLTPFYGDGVGHDIPISQIGMGGSPFERVSLGGLVASGTLTQFPLVVVSDQPDLFGIASVWGTCTINLTGFEATAGQCGIWTEPAALGSENWSTGFGFVSSGAPVSVPGPIVGVGLPALLAACGGLLVVSRRRQSIA